MKTLNAIFFTLILIAFTSLSWANRLSLYNDSSYPLNVVVSDATQTTLTEIMLNSGDTNQWSDTTSPFNTDSSMYLSQAPYTVSWYCMNGQLYGTCTDVAPQSIVNAQSCSGPQECNGQGGL
jgi:hypothetical protein